MFDHLRLIFNAANIVKMNKMCVKYQNASQAVCAYLHIFRKQAGCTLTGACAPIRTNTVVPTDFCLGLNIATQHPGGI